MDDFLALLGDQAWKYAMRCAMHSGFAATSTYAIKQCTRLLPNIDDQKISSELKSLQRLLHGKIKVFTARFLDNVRRVLTFAQIISPAIDLVEFK